VNVYVSSPFGTLKVHHADQRIQTLPVFRRDPLLQVTMNIALSPLVRCIFDEEALALRLIHKEPIVQENMPAGQKPTEVVIYVLKVN
jgi:hypothetical protein